MKKHVKKLYAVTAILFWIAVWHFAAVRVGKSILLPTPAETVKVLVSLASESAFWQICFSSVRSIFVGAVVGVFAGIAIAVLSYLSPIVKYLFSPVMSLIKATPIASFIILFLVWIGKDVIPFWIALMMVAPIVASNFLEGLENIDPQLKEVMTVYGFNFQKRWRMLYRYSLLPYLNSSLKSGIALAWKAGIAAEVLCTPDNTVGQMLYESKLYMETESLFAWTLTVIAISFVLEKAVVLISDYFMGGVAK